MQALDDDRSQKRTLCYTGSSMEPAAKIGVSVVTIVVSVRPCNWSIAAELIGCASRQRTTRAHPFFPQETPQAMA